MAKAPYEVVLRGRESASPSLFSLYDDARWYADDLAKQTGREARVYDTRQGMNARPVYRTGTRSDERF